MMDIHDIKHTKIAQSPKAESMMCRGDDVEPISKQDELLMSQIQF